MPTPSWLRSRRITRLRRGVNRLTLDLIDLERRVDRLEASMATLRHDRHEGAH